MKRSNWCGRCGKSLARNSPETISILSKVFTVFHWILPWDRVWQFLRNVTSFVRCESPNNKQKYQCGLMMSEIFLPLSVGQCGKSLATPLRNNFNSFKIIHYSHWILLWDRVWHFLRNVTSFVRCETPNNKQKRSVRIDDVGKLSNLECRLVWEPGTQLPWNNFNSFKIIQCFSLNLALRSSVTFSKKCHIICKVRNA